MSSAVAPSNYDVAWISCRIASALAARWTALSLAALEHGLLIFKVARLDALRNAVILLFDLCSKCRASAIGQCHGLLGSGSSLARCAHGSSRFPVAASKVQHGADMLDRKSSNRDKSSFMGARSAVSSLF